MSFLKCAKFWSALALVASVTCISVVFWSMFSVQSGSMGFRDAAGLVRQTVQVGAGIAIASALIFVYSLIKGALLARIMSGVATLLVAALVVIAVTSQPSDYDQPPGPPLNDISTDTLDPPMYDAVIALRPEGSNTLEYPGESAVLRQAEAFPDIKPINSGLSVQAAFDRSIEVVEDMGWELIAEDAATGIIEAVATTSFFGFKDDVVIRVRPDGNGSIVDIRSHSRLGRGDAGKNAGRIRKFIAEF